jgi:hypothetical protein
MTAAPAHDRTLRRKKSANFIVSSAYPATTPEASSDVFVAKGDDSRNLAKS